MASASITARSLSTLLGDWQGAGAQYAALADRVRLLVLDGRIPVDTRLPAERELAEALGLSRTTVSAAYAQLRDADFLHSIRGSGSLTRLPEGPRSIPLPTDTGILDFSKASLPALPWLAETVRQAADELPRHLGDSGYDPVGIPELRAAIAERYADRGLPTEPDEIMVTIGAQHAIALLARTLIGRGDRVLVEQPSYPHAYEALRAAGGRFAPASVVAGDDGGEADSMVQAIERTSPAVGYLMPDFHNPTGRSMSEEDRARVVDAAARAGTLLIADETTAELDIDRLDAHAPFAVHGDAVLIGSVGKTVWGGVRVGWIRAPRPLIRKLVAARHPGDLGTPILEQLVVTALMPQMPEILELRREQLRAGREHLEAALADGFPEWDVPHVDGGLSTWINLGSPVSSQLALAARTHGLIIAAGPRFGIDGAFERFLRLPIGYSAEETDAALAALALAWRSLARTPVVDPSFLADVV
ncbi:MocR-like transcription factor YczR [Agromyces atrinae]|uniref:DNA-binding transcriptional MocR family regulator n=1 Tax=Agromyces atrinae TaxID=592376 RepID=A0A4Q2M994_9MICO|nr:PLP-dependent aminotransferase family protein [Agromyces atrinae]NYD68258.1 DNA-binding transcriptional MocR family regulator [Agromyces atrinae]RXZ85680.1 PLP-dependent aminotransferase family protein [Agromyces atrinae]